MTTKMTRRSAFTLAAAALAAPATVRAETALPDKTLKILVGFPAGGGSDVMARFIAEALKQRTGRNVIIDNKSGASGTLADPQTDLMPVTMAGTVQTAFCVSPTIGVNSLPEYIEWLKKNPARNSFGTTAMGSFTHFFGVMAGQAIGVPLEPVPYRGAAPLVADLQGGHIAAGCGGITDFLEHHRAGKVKVIFTSGAKRATSAPDIPTGAELGYPSLNILGWYVFFAPPRTPSALIDAWGDALRAVLRMPEVEKKMTEFGLDVETSTPQEFSQRMAADFERWKEILDSIGYKPAN